MGVKEEQSRKLIKSAAGANVSPRRRRITIELCYDTFGKIIQLPVGTIKRRLTLKFWPSWHLKSMRDEHGRKGLPLLDEDAAPTQCQGEAVPAPDIITVKDFLRFYIASSHPQLKKGPTSHPRLMNSTTKHPSNERCESAFPTSHSLSGVPTQSDSDSCVF
jgi:hypothetical protein